jgi:hypothetical protein
MATNDQELQEQKQQRDNLKLRTALNTSYAALEGAKYTNSVLAFSFEEAVDQQIQRIEGPGTSLRPSELERVDRVEQQLLKAVEEIKQVPPEFFLSRLQGRDVNTDEE